MKFQTLKKQVEQGDSKGMNIQIPQLVLDKVEAYQKAYKAAHPAESKPTKPNVILLILADGFEGLNERIQELAEMHQKMEASKI